MRTSFLSLSGSLGAVAVVHQVGWGEGLADILTGLWKDAAQWYRLTRCFGSLIYGCVDRCTQHFVVNAGEQYSEHDSARVGNMRMHAWGLHRQSDCVCASNSGASKFWNRMRAHGRCCQCYDTFASPMCACTAIMWSGFRTFLRRRLLPLRTTTSGEVMAVR